MSVVAVCDRLGTYMIAALDVDALMRPVCSFVPSLLSYTAVQLYADRVI